MNAIITGASSGMGWYFAREVASRGYNVTLVARSKDKLMQLASEIKTTYGVETYVLPLDLTLEESVNKLIKFASKTDLLINNAGFGLEHRAWEADLAKVRSMMRLNMETLTILTYGFIKDFTKRDHGRIINISSISGYMKAFPIFSSYGPGKDYVKKFSRSVRHDLEIAKSNVKIQTITPGIIDTNFYNDNSGISQKHMTRADHFAKVVMHRTLDQNKKEVTYGKMGKTFQYLSKFVPAKIVSRIIIASTKK